MMHFLPHVRWIGFFVPLVALTPLVVAQGNGPNGVAASQQSSSDHPTGEDTRFLRFVGDGIKGGSLETSDAVYQNADGVTVRLVSVVHIGEPAYFRDIQSSFGPCDAVLYEMVKPRGSGAPEKGAHSDSGISKLQRFLKDRLDLAFQLDEIDYSPDNFVHADLDAETFRKMQSDRGESFASIFLAGLLRSITDPGATQRYEDEPVDVVDLMTRPDGDRQLKLIIARHLGDIEREAMGLDMLSGTVILTERNKAVMKTLDETLKDGKREIAIFYGAAHMPELADGLEKRGFKHAKTRWRAAWDATIRQNEPSAFTKLMGQAGQKLLQPEQR